MKDNEIIEKLRERRESFAAKFGFDPKKIAEAAMSLVDRQRFVFVGRPVSLSHSA